MNRLLQQLEGPSIVNILSICYINTSHCQPLAHGGHVGWSSVYCQTIVKIFHQHISHTFKVDTWAGAQAECDSLGGFLVEAKLVILRISFLSNFSIIVYFVEVKYNSGLYHCHKKLCILLPQDGGGSPDTFPACDGCINKYF